MTISSAAATGQGIIRKEPEARSDTLSEFDYELKIEISFSHSAADDVRCPR